MSFKSLVSVVSEQCHEVKQALKLFPYFETWDESVIAECCRLSSVLEFPPDNIIYDSKTGNSHVVYFVLNGVCKMIHHLRVRVKTDSYGRPTYKLFSSTGSSSSKTESNTVGFSSLLLTENYDFEKKVGTEGVETEKTEIAEERMQSPVASSSVKDEVIGGCENEKADDEEDEEPSNTDIVPDDNVDDVSLPKEEESDIKDTESPKDESESGGSEEEGGKQVEEKVDEATMKPRQSQPSNEHEEEGEERDKDADEAKREIIYEPDHHIKVLEECKNKSRQTIRLIEDGQESDIPEDVKSFFLQVALFYKGACFGLEKNVKDRIMISATKVKCLRIPRQFLLQHNPSNIWNRIRLFLDLYLPKADNILDYFIQDRKWAEDKRKEAEMIVFSNSIFNYTMTAHVPYSIRLLEDIPTADVTNNKNNRERATEKTRKSKTE